MIDWNNSYNSGAYTELLSCATSITNKKEEDKNMDNSNTILTKGIIGLWLKMNFREIDKYFDDNESKVKDNDCNAKTIKSHIADIIEIMCCNRDMTSAEKELYANKSFNYIESLVGRENLYSKDILENIESLTHDYGVMKRKCQDIYNEVKVMCQPCETYEQEMAVLKAYNIVDESGKIVVHSLNIENHKIKNKITSLKKR